MLLQELKFDVYYRPGVQHAVADYLSRLQSSEAGDVVRDEFLDADLFKVTVEMAVDEIVVGEDKWLMDMNQFLSSRLPP